MHTNLVPGFDLAQVRLTFHPIWDVNIFLAYGEQFDLIPQPTSYGNPAHGHRPDPVIGTYVVELSLWSSGVQLGDFVPLSQALIHTPLILRYGCSGKSEVDHA